MSETTTARLATNHCDHCGWTEEDCRALPERSDCCALCDHDEADADAPRPSVGALARWTTITGDEAAALLCATADEAADAALVAMDDLMRDECSSNVQARVRARRRRDAARADVRQYYGDTLGDQPAAVLRAAGYRV